MLSPHETDDGKWEHVFHQSWLNTYFACPEMARVALTHEYPDPPTERAAIGTAVHAGIELVLNELAQPDEAISHAFKTFREEMNAEGARWVKTKKESTCLAHIEGGFASWWDYVYPVLSASQLVEGRFRFLVHEDEERRIYWGGTLDYAEEGRVDDWKVTQNKDKYGTKFGQDGWEQKRWAIQPTMYVAAYAAMFPTIKDLPTFRFVALDVAGREPQVLLVERDTGHIGWLVNQCLSIAHFIEANGTAGLWPLRDQHALCSGRWCVKWADCKGKFINLMGEQ